MGSIGIALPCATPRPSRIRIPRARHLSTNSAHRRDLPAARAGLAGPRLANDADHLTAAAARALECGVERSHLAVAPDERREPAGPRAIEARAERPHCLEIKVPDRLTHALDRDPAQILELKIPLDEACRVL